MKSAKPRNQNISIREGSRMTAYIGKHADFKKEVAVKVPRFDRDALREMIPQRHEQRLEKIENDYKKANELGIPLAKFKGRTKLGGQDAVVFEKVDLLTNKERLKRAEEIKNIIHTASEKGIKFDANIHNFGVKRGFFSRLFGLKGKIVLLDADIISRTPQEKLTDEMKNKYSEEMHKHVTDSIDRLQIPLTDKITLKNKLLRE